MPVRLHADHVQQLFEGTVELSPPSTVGGGTGRARLVVEQLGAGGAGRPGLVDGVGGQSAADQAEHVEVRGVIGGLLRQRLKFDDPTGCMAGGRGQDRQAVGHAGPVLAAPLVAVPLAEPPRTVGHVGFDQQIGQPVEAVTARLEPSGKFNRLGFGPVGEQEMRVMYPARSGRRRRWSTQ